MCLEQLYPAFWLSGGIWVGRDSILVVILCFTLGLREPLWRMASKDRLSLVCVLVSVELVVIVDGGGNGYDRESNWLNWSCFL